VGVNPTKLAGMTSMDPRVVRRALRELSDWPDGPPDEEHDRRPGAGLVELYDTAGALWRFFMRSPEEALVARRITGDQQRPLSLSGAADNSAQNCPRPNQRSKEEIYIDQPSKNQSAPAGATLRVDFERGQNCARRAQDSPQPTPIAAAVENLLLRGRLDPAQYASDLIRSVDPALRWDIALWVAEAVSDGRIKRSDVEAKVAEVQRRKPANRGGYFHNCCVNLFATYQQPWLDGQVPRPREKRNG
jgi:hypothetical protein